MQPIPNGEHEAAEVVAAALMTYAGAPLYAKANHDRLAPTVTMEAADGRKYQLIVTEMVTGINGQQKDTGDADQAPAGESTATPDEPRFVDYPSGRAPLQWGNQEGERA